ncbi:hypothetical protein [Frankia sp. CcI49]|uniref:hypothetical protein n=1 Tax=Frankia sp. CcI49 TaxID=1745382 RepID=UPI00105588A3|nr:hypothetical protein [Frankia sp. CcI49]
MSQDWVTPVATALVGVAGIAGAVYAARMQRGAQLESVARQQSLEASAAIRLEKRAAFVEFWNAYQNIFRKFGFHRREGNVADRADSGGRADAFAQLLMARNKVALLCSLYTMYYMDQLMGDVEEMVETPLGTTLPAPRFPDASHHVYYLMRAELAGQDLSAKDADALKADLRANARSQVEIAQVLGRS